MVRLPTTLAAECFSVAIWNKLITVHVPICRHDEIESVGVSFLLAVIVGTIPSPIFSDSREGKDESL